MLQPADGSQRLDKWLFYARLVKTRALAATLAESGGVRINGQKTAKAAALVRPGDVLTIALPGRILICRITACADRRGPAPEAQKLYDEIAAPATKP
ncbi:MAG: RNA-binding S4 domain-containing protein [Rhizobiaceae bacterium]